MKITLLIGLPGSGKTYLGKQLKGLFIDDASKNKGLLALTYLSNAVLKNRPIKFVTEKTDLIIADPMFCTQETLQKAKAKLGAMFPGYEIECIYFENDPEKCLRNVRIRNDGRLVYGLIRGLSKKYVIPEGIIPRKIWDNSNGKFV